MHHTRTALACVAVAVGVAACSTPTKSPPPTVGFGRNGGTSVGMPGMSGMPDMPMPQATTSTSTPPVAGTAVTITDFAFAPANLTVKVGDTVTWTNKDEEPHNVVANDGSFRSPGLDSDGTYSYTFTKAGSFDYICGIHPFMRGTVVVSR